MHTRMLSADPPSPPCSRGATPNAEPDLLASLSLSSKPVLPAHPPAGNPIFGLPSFPSVSGSSAHANGSSRPPSGMILDDDDDERDPDAMDVDPASPVKQPQNDDGTWMRPQRFFAPEEPTGLETLFARTIRIADTAEQTGSTSRTARHTPRTLAGVALRAWWWPACFIVATFLAIGAYQALDTRKQRTAMYPEML